MTKDFTTAAMASALMMGTLLPLVAQDDIPLLRPEERKVLTEQADDFNKALSPVLADSAKSTVRIWQKGRLAAGKYVAYGTVVGDGSQVLSKWSELRMSKPGSLLVQSSEGDAVAAKMVITAVSVDSTTPSSIG